MRWLRFLVLAILSVPAVVAAQPRAIVAPTGGTGVEEPLLPILTGALRERVTARGWVVLSEEETDPPVLVAATPPVPTVQEMRRLAGTARVRLTAHLELRAMPGGKVLVRVRSATREDPGSWEATEEVRREDVIPSLARLSERAIPPAAVVAGSPAPPPPGPPVVAPGPGGEPPIVSPGPGGQPPIVSPGPGGQPPIVSPGPGGQPPIVSPTPGGEPPIVSPTAGGAPPVMENTAPAGEVGVEEDITPSPPRLTRRPLRYHLWVGPFAEGAIGTNREYYNQLAGGRATYLLNRQFGFGAAATYAYFSDDPGFALVFWGGVEARLALSTTRRTAVPVRFGFGFAPVNGPLLKLEAGILLPLSPTTDLVVTLLAPTIWFLEGGNAVSMNLGIELAFAAG